MLTKDLIRFRVYKGKLKPSFINAQDLENLMLAGQLLDIFRDSTDLTRATLAEACDSLVQIFPGEAVVARGLVKLLLDRTKFEEPSDEELPAFRELLFATGGTLLQQNNFTTQDDYYEALSAAMGSPVKTLARRMFSDLPEEHAVEGFRDITEEKLLHRYNTAQVQWLLLHAESLQITLSQTRPALLRQVLKYLRFRQLFAQIEMIDTTTCRLVVDGPMSLFGARGKYGMNLALFFPALLHQPKWKLETLVNPKGRTFTFEIDQSSPLKATSSSYLAYVPAEIMAFQESFASRSDEWRLETDTDILPLPGEVYCFPDFRFVHSSGLVVVLELFHPWHQSVLIERLKQVQHIGDTILLIGAARKILKEAKLAEATQASAYFQKWGFAFNDIPTSNQILQLLKAALPASEPKKKGRTKKSAEPKPT